MAEAVTWQGHPALRLDGLAVLPGVQLRSGRLEVWIGAEGACYPGLVFRQQDAGNYELAYAQPHTSGLWDTLQYDPVINATNTWQLYHGPAYQQLAEVPTGRWFLLPRRLQGKAGSHLDRSPGAAGRRAAGTPAAIRRRGHLDLPAGLLPRPAPLQPAQPARGPRHPPGTRLRRGHRLGSRSNSVD